MLGSMTATISKVLGFQGQSWFFFCIEIDEKPKLQACSFCPKAETSFCFKSLMISKTNGFASLKASSEETMAGSDLLIPRSPCSCSKYTM